MTTVEKALARGWVVGCLCLGLGPWLATAAAADAGGPREEAGGVYVTLRIPLGAEQLADTPVALVDDEPITLGELTRELASMHADMAPGATPANETYTRLLERLVDTRLILLEAENIGLQERYGIQAQINEFADKLLRDQVMARALKDVQVDNDELETLYRRMARAVKLEVLRFTDEGVVKAFEEEMARGDEFTEIARRLEGEGKARQEGGDDYLKLKDLRPQIAQAVIDMPIGDVSQVFQDESGFLAFRLADARVEEDEGVKAEARRILLERARSAAVGTYGKSLIEKHARINQRLLESVDFEMEHTGLFGLGETQPVDFAKLLEDKRVLATVTGEEPIAITVGDLARALQAKLYHGPEKAAAFGRLNERKVDALENLVFKLAAKREAIEQGIDQTEAFAAAVDEKKRSLLFGAFIRKVVAPEVTLSEEEVRSYYDAHLSDYATPGMVRLRSLAFTEERSAEEAATKLKKGTDFAWVSSNVQGQADKNATDLLEVDNRLLTTNSLPEGLRNMVTDARGGDVLRYDSPEGYNYVLLVSQMIPAASQPYERVRGEISKIVFNDKLKAAMDGWVEKLKAHYDTRIFVTGFEL